MVRFRKHKNSIVLLEGKAMQLVFVYETLDKLAIRRRVLERKIIARSASLSGWVREVVQIKGQGYATFNQDGEALVEGWAFEVNMVELEAIDAWAENHRRIRVKLDDGRFAWAYRLKKRPPAALR